MGIPAGPFYIDDTLTFTTNTHRVDTGAATDADSVPTYRVYEDETGTAILNGSMAKLDDANTTGFYSEQLTLSAANGFEVGKSYSVYISATVNSVTATKSDNFKVITNPQTLLSAIDTKTTNLPSDPADASVVAGLIAAVETKVDAIDLVVDAILVDTAEIGVAGAGLTNINLPNQTMDIVGNITGNLSGSVGSVTGAVGSVTGAVGSVTGLTASDVGAIKAKTDNLPSDPADASVIAGRFDTIDTSIADLPTNAELATALGTADDAVLTAISGLNDPTPAEIATAVLTTQMTESYAADGVAPTVAQALFLIQQQLGDFSITSTTLTVKKLDGSTTAATFNLDSSTSPTAVTRAS